MTGGARVGNFVFIGHRRRDETERVRVDESVGQTFGFDRGHAAGHALAAGAARGVVRVFFDRRGAWAVARHGRVAIQAEFIGRLAE